MQPHTKERARQTISGHGRAGTGIHGRIATTPRVLAWVRFQDGLDFKTNRD